MDPKDLEKALQTIGYPYSDQDTSINVTRRRLIGQRCVIYGKSRESSVVQSSFTTITDVHIEAGKILVEVHAERLFGRTLLHLERFVTDSGKHWHAAIYVNEEQEDELPVTFRLRLRPTRHANP